MKISKRERERVIRERGIADKERAIAD